MKKKTIPKLKDKADKIFSKYIRLRDAIRTTGLKSVAKCITCGEMKDIKYSMDAGHWMGRGAGKTRYDPKNVHAQCKGCNKWNKGGQVPENYRRALIDLYGESEVERIYRDSKSTHRFTRIELEDIIKTYKERYKDLG